MGAAMFCLGWLSLAILYCVVSRFLARLFHTTGRLVHTIVQGNCSFKVIGQETCRLSLSRRKQFLMLRGWVICIAGFHWTAASFLTPVHDPSLYRLSLFVRYGKFLLSLISLASLCAGVNDSITVHWSRKDCVVLVIMPPYLRFISVHSPSRPRLIIL